MEAMRHRTQQAGKPGEHDAEQPAEIGALPGPSSRSSAAVSVRSARVSLRSVSKPLTVSLRISRSSSRISPRMPRISARMSVSPAFVAAAISSNTAMRALMFGIGRGGRVHHGSFSSEVDRANGRHRQRRLAVDRVGHCPQRRPVDPGEVDALSHGGRKAASRVTAEGDPILDYLAINETLPNEALDKAETAATAHTDRIASGSAEALVKAEKVAERLIADAGVWLEARMKVAGDAAAERVIRDMRAEREKAEHASHTAVREK